MSDLDYTLVQSALEIGGSVKRAVSLDTGEILQAVDGWSGPACGAEGFPEGDTAPACAPLSTLHISPFVEWASGAGLLKVSQGIPGTPPVGGKRGKITGFSFASRRRLMQTIARIRFDAPLPMFVTLTYPNKFPTPLESKKHIDRFLKRLHRKFSGVGGVCKLEPQQRGAPHYHMLVYGVPFQELAYFVPFAWHDIAGDGDDNHLKFHLGLLDNELCVQEVRSRQGVMRYASKYLGKTFEVSGWDEVYPGRFWSVFGKENVPFGQSMVMYITKKDAHIWMRYQRRFANIKKHLNRTSLTTFCNADQWTENLMEVHREEK